MRKDHGQPGSGLVDDAVLQELFQSVADGAPAIMVDLIDTCLLDSRRRILEISQALQDQNAAQLELSAHSLKSSMATFGAFDLAARFAEIERLARQTRIEMASQKVGCAQRLFIQVHRFLDGEAERLRRLEVGDP